MDIKMNTGVRIHNKHDIFIRYAESGELVQRGYAENIVLDRIYTRLLNFQSYFDNIVFGTGTGEFSPARTTLFNRVGSKAAVTEQLIRAYPTSVWTKKITLGTGEFNGYKFTEVGISDTTTNINTHALITDAEGNPLQMETKTELMIIDIYSTVYVEVYDVDSGLFLFADGLRDYLTGTGTPNNSIRLRYMSDDDAVALTGTRTSNAGAKTVTVAVKFDVQHFNKDVKYIDWMGLGMRCVLPRTGVFTSHERIGVSIGVGDGVRTRFPVPNRGVSNASFKVDGAVVTGWTLDGGANEVIFDSPPGALLLITADLTCTLIPKDIDHILNITMTMSFGGGLPTPIMPDPDYSLLPGPKVLSKGTKALGYYGETTAAEFITPEALSTTIGLTPGTLINADANWLKYSLDGSLIYVCKKNIRHSASWDHINAAGAVWGDKIIEIDGMLFAVRLLSTQEWDKLIYPVHVNYGQFAQFTDAELNISGIYTWTSSPQGANRLIRGSYSVTHSGNIPPSGAYSAYGFRPVLVFLRTL